MVDMSNFQSDLVRIKDKYQVTIPPEIREALDLCIDDYIQFEWDDTGTISLYKVEINGKK